MKKSTNFFKNEKKRLVWISLFFICFLYFRPYFEKKIISFFYPSPSPQLSLQVSKILEDGTFIIQNQKYKLAGVSFPENSFLCKQASIFLKIALQQGVEIRKKVSKNEYFFLCNPKTYSCASSNLFRFRKISLNELFIMSGYATFNSETVGLSAIEKKIFAKCRTDAVESLGIEPSSERFFDILRMDLESVAFRHITILELDYWLKAQYKTEK